MPGKIKIFFGVLALVTLFLIYSVFNYLNGRSSSIVATNTQTPLLNPNADPDHDGLTNQQEMIWGTDPFNPDTDGDGYLDGEEVASGHDPLIPGPNDLLNTSKNITNSVSDLVVEGLYSKDLKPDATNYAQSISAISQSVIDDFNREQPPLLKPKLTSVGSSKEEQELYLNNIAQIVKQSILIHPLGSDYQVNPDKYADQYITSLLVLKYSFTDVYQKLLQLPVPDNWQDIHYTLIDIVNRSAVNYGFVGSYQSDPYRATLALSELQNLDDETKQLLAQISSRISQNHLTLDNNFYQLLKQLNPQ